MNDRSSTREILIINYFVIMAITLAIPWIF